MLVTVQQSGLSADRVVKELRQSGVLPTKEPDIVDFMTYRGEREVGYLGTEVSERLVFMGNEVR